MTLDGFADVAVDAIDGAHRNETVPVAGPDDWRFGDLVRGVRAAVGSRALIVRAPAALALAGLTEWLARKDVASTLVRHYVSELDRHFRQSPVVSHQSPVEVRERQD